MADDVAITAGSGTTIATDNRTINSASVHVQRVDEQGSTAIATAQTNISNSAVTLIAARETRKRVVILNKQLETVWIGPATVTTANGFPLDPGASVTVYTTALIQGITAAATADAAKKMQTLEEYDA